MLYWSWCSLNLQTSVKCVRRAGCDPVCPPPTPAVTEKQLCSCQHFSPHSTTTFPQVPSNKYRLAPPLSPSACRINHFHNYTFWGAPWVKRRRHKYSSLLYPSCLLPRPLQDYLRLFSAPLAEAEELVSGAAGFGEKLVAVGLQLPVARGQAAIGPPQVFHGRCVYSIMGWQFPHKALELLWLGGEKKQTNKKEHE